MASEFLWSLPHPNKRVSPPIVMPEGRHSLQVHCDDIFNIFDTKKTNGGIQRFDTPNSPFTPSLDDDASDAFRSTPGRASSPIPSRYTNYDGQVKCIDWAYEAKLQPPVPVVPASPSSRLARMTRIRHREYKMAQSGIPIPLIGNGDPRNLKRKLSFPFPLKRLAKKVQESPGPPITPEQPSPSISPRIRSTVGLPENLKGTSFVHSPSSPKTPTRRRHYHSHSRTRSKHSVPPKLFLLKNEPFAFGTSMQEKMEPLLPVVEAIYSDLDAHRPPLMSGPSSKRKRDDEGDTALKSRPSLRVRVDV